MFNNIEELLEGHDMNNIDEPKTWSNEVHSEEERERQCKDCLIVYPLFDDDGNVSYKYFEKNMSANTGGGKYWRTDCRECKKKSAKGRVFAKRKYATENGISVKEVRSPYTECQLTGRPQTSSNKPIVFDHCNITHRFRGWLHDSTNRAIGMLKTEGSDVKGLLRALNYCNTTEEFSLSVDDKGEVVINEK